MSQNDPITINSWTLGTSALLRSVSPPPMLPASRGIGLRAETYVDALNEGAL